MDHKRKGIVMEIHNQKAIVLTPDGQFLNHYYQGKPPELGVEVSVNNKRYDWSYWRLGAIAAIFAIIIIPIITLQLQISPVIVAYVTVDINPSIELAIDSEDKVVNVNPLNAKGKQLIKSVNLKNVSIEKALELITEEAIKENYITTDRENTVVISYSNLTKSTSKGVAEADALNRPLLKQTQLEDKVKAVVARNQQQVAVEIVHVSLEFREKALELGVSSGKYALMLEAEEVGLEIDIETIKEKGIFQAIKEAGGNPGHILTYLHNHKDKYIISDDPLSVDNLNDKMMDIAVSKPEVDLNNTDEVANIKELSKSLINNLPMELQLKRIAELQRDKDKSSDDLLKVLRDRMPEEIVDKLISKEDAEEELEELTIDQDIIQKEEENEEELKDIKEAQ